MSERSWDEVVRALLVEAGKAIDDKSRDFRTPDLPDFVKSAATTVSKGVEEARAYSSSVAKSLATGIGSGLVAFGKHASNQLKSAGGDVGRGVTVLADQAEALRKWIVPAGSLRRSEKEALLQDAIRKQNAAIRELHAKNTANSERLEYLNWLVVQLGAVVKNLKEDVDPIENVLTVLTAHHHQIAVEDSATNRIAAQSSHVVAHVHRLLGELETSTRASQFLPVTTTPSRPALRPWSELLAEARAQCVGKPSFDNVLSSEEQSDVERRLIVLSSEFKALHQLTSYDYAAAGVAGILGALADIFLVIVPKHPEFLGSAGSEGGWLSNIVREKFGQLLPPETVRSLEREYIVPYDAATNAGLTEPVHGLSPRSHRLHSVGHDPILGWIVGVSDILKGRFTAIGSDGATVSQTIAGWQLEEAGSGIVADIISALRSVGGHMLSDVSTPMGLPPPLFVLSQFLQVGAIRGRNVAEIAQLMYRQGYDFRHFSAGGLCVALVDVIVRIAWVVREINEGCSFEDAIPLASKPRLRTGLLLAHSVAAAVNAGKIVVTQNPLSLNLAQWLALIRYLLPQIHWLLVEKERQREAFVQRQIDNSWTLLNSEISDTWKIVFRDEPAAVL